MAGSKVSGHIYLESKKKGVPGKSVILYLKGFEETEFGTRTKYCGRTQVISMKFPIARWNSGHSIEVG